MLSAASRTALGADLSLSNAIFERATKLAAISLKGSFMDTMRVIANDVVIED